MDSGDDFVPNIRGHFGLRLQTKRFNLQILINEGDFIGGKQNIAILLEGIFSSVFQNRIPLEIQNNKDIDFKEKTESENKMVIISDSHFINNQFLKGDALPLGFDKHTGTQYGNGTFIFNTIDYLLGNEVFIQVRSKNIKLRLLNQQKTKSEKILGASNGNFNLYEFSGNFSLTNDLS